MVKLQCIVAVGISTVLSDHYGCARRPWKSLSVWCDRLIGWHSNYGRVHFWVSERVRPWPGSHMRNRRQINYGKHKPGHKPVGNSNKFYANVTRRLFQIVYFFRNMFFECWIFVAFLFILNYTFEPSRRGPSMTRYFWFCNYTPPWMFLSLDILF